MVRHIIKMPSDQAVMRRMGYVRMATLMAIWIVCDQCAPIQMYSVNITLAGTVAIMANPIRYECPY
jgi:hypothetical protein